MNLPDDPFEAIQAMLSSRREWSHHIEKLADTGSDSIERELLMQFWADLGDHTETYWEALNVAAIFVKSLKAVRENIPATNRSHIAALKALASCIYFDARVGEIMLREQEKIDV